MPVKLLDATRLESLLESAQLLNSSLDLDSLLQHLLRTVMGRVLSGRGFIAVFDDGQMKLAQIRGLKTLKVGDAFDEQIARAAGIDTIYKIGDAEKPTGLLGISRPLKGTIAPDEEESLKALLGLAASSIANAQAHSEANRVNVELAQKIQELRALLDLVRGLTSTLEPEAVAQLLILTLTGRWAVGKYALAVQKENHPPVVRHKGIELPPIEDFAAIASLLPEASIVGELPDGEFKSFLEAQNAQVVFPINSSASTRGILALGSRLGKKPFTKSDLEFGAGLVAQAGVAFENSWFVLETIERKKIEQELELAAKIQEGLFPEFLPRIEGYDLAAKNRPARWCGGDYYDVLAIKKSSETTEKSYLACVADVSGKGMPASLLMSNMQATLRALLGRVPSLVELASRTNELLYATSPSNKFVTAILFEFFPDSGKAIYVNAGHGDCMLLRGENGAVEKLESTGLPLGMMPTEMLEMLDKNYEERHLQINAGDLLALYSDGVTEAYDEQENEWGDENLIKCLKSDFDLSAERLTEKVIEQIDEFAQTAPQHDDITIFILRRR